MKYFKKYPLFFVVTAVLLLAFAGMAGFDVYLNSQRATVSKKLSREMNSYRDALADDPTQKAIDASKSNIDKLKDHLAFLEKDLTRASASIFKPLTAKEGYQLVEQLRGFVNSWRKEARKLEIDLSDSMDFGFKKYVAPNAEPPKEEALEAIWKQACVLNYVNKKLFACKSDKSPMWILNVQRELLPEEGVKDDGKQRRNARARRNADSQSGDNFKIDPAITARKAGSLDTIAYKFTFAGHTDVLRRFLNQLKDFDAMLVVRSIDVKPADYSQLEHLKEKPSDDFGDANAQSAPTGLDAIFGAAANAEAAAAAQTDGSDQQQPQQASRTPVVTDNVSEFTVVIEYVEVVKPDQNKKPAAEAK